MSYETKYTVTRRLSEGYEKCISPSRYLTYSLTNMMTEMRDNLAHVLYNECHLRWVMTHETFNWIMCHCSEEYGFDYEVQIERNGENKYILFDIEVEFVDDDLKRLNAEVELIYVEPVLDHVKWNVHTAYPTVTIREAIESMPWFKDLQRLNTEVKEENLMKSFYVGCGKKVTIENVIFNNPATIVFWSDGTKTVVKRQKGDKKFDPEKGLAMAICKKVMGNKGNFNDIFKEWIEED